MAQKSRNVVGLPDPCFNVMLFHKNTKGWEELCKGKGSIFGHRTFCVVLVLMVRFILFYRIIPNKKDHLIPQWRKRVLVTGLGSIQGGIFESRKANCFLALKVEAKLAMSAFFSAVCASILCYFSCCNEGKNCHIHRHNREHVSQELPLWQRPLGMWLKTTECWLWGISSLHFSCSGDCRACQLTAHLNAMWQSKKCST